MNEIQDILIYETGDGGDLSLQNDDIVSTESIINSIYLALFGGNVEQNTTTDIAVGEVRNDWWGNALGLDFNSNFERTLDEVALNSFGVSKLEDAAKKDLQFLNDYTTFEVSIIIDTVDKMTLTVSLLTAKVKFIFDRIKNEIIQEIII